MRGKQTKAESANIYNQALVLCYTRSVTYRVQNVDNFDTRPKQKRKPPNLNRTKTGIASMPNGYVSDDSNDDAQWNTRTNGMWVAVVRGICYVKRAAFRLFLHLSRYISLNTIRIPLQSAYMWSVVCCYMYDWLYFWITIYIVCFIKHNHIDNFSHGAHIQKLPAYLASLRHICSIRCYMRFLLCVVLPLSASITVKEKDGNNK